MATPRPYTLVAELTYKCPLRCAYCSNPTEREAHGRELSAEQWIGVLDDAEALGVMAVHFTGGEPLLRKELETLVAHARGRGLYTNLITSGVPLARERLVAMKTAGLDHVQLSFQDTDAASAERVAGVSAMAEKLAVASWVKELGLPLTVNVVLHAGNIDRIEEIVALGERVGADRLELAHTQYLGWALTNRAALLPTAAQIERSRAVGRAAKERLEGRIDVLMVLPDYVAGRPRPCMDGWARRFLLVSPDGLVLPCHAAHTLPGMGFESVTSRPLRDIWADSPPLARFRGEGWMQEPCKSCDRRSVDYGGCRCQAFHLSGHAESTDPACGLAPDHHLITDALAVAETSAPRPGFVLRRLPVVRA